MFHFSSLQMFLLPSRVLNVKTKNGHQQGGVIDVADICSYTLKYLWISVFNPLRLYSFSSLVFCLYRSLVPDTLHLSLYMSLTENSNPKLPVWQPLFTPLPACISMSICKGKGPALLIRSTALLKRFHRERWWYCCSQPAHHVLPQCWWLMMSAISRGPLSDMDAPTKQSQG